jgi:alpha-beta hydrolase superfamily lysophospholipase
VSDVEPVFAMLHNPAERGQRDTAVLLCPPFGWEDVCSYRPRRAWAQHLAAAGYPALRVELPGAGDSGGSPGDSGRLDAWTEAIASAADWLGAATGRRRVAAIGVGLGGMLICRAAAEGAPIAEAVLWAVPSRGRTFVRELRAFGRSESSKFSPGGDFKAQPLPRGYIEAGGFVLSSETVKALERLDLAKLELPEDRLRRVLLLERDGIGVDERLVDHLEQTGEDPHGEAREQAVGKVKAQRSAEVPEQSGRDVRVTAGAGYDAMMGEPQGARPPFEVFAEVEAWLSEVVEDDVIVPVEPSDASRLVDERVGRKGPNASPSVLSTRLARERDTAELTIGDAVIRERSLPIEQPFGRLFGVLTEPAMEERTDLGAVLLNAGAIRHIGPNRMWVELARRWAARGVPSLRLDLEGLGDSDGDDTRFSDVAELYVPQLVDQVQTAIDVVESHGVAQRFVLVGLCSGAYWSFHGALRDERVAAAFMLNPRTLFWDASQETVRYLPRGLFQAPPLRTVLRGEVPRPRPGGGIREAPRSLFRRAVSRVQAFGDGDQSDLLFDLLRDKGKQLLFAFSENEPLHQELVRQGRLPRNERWPNMRLELIPGRDRTLRPHYSQERAHEALDRALDRELSRTPAG